MVPFTNRIWYHFPYQYGTIFSFNMVPFSIAIWYHILSRFRPYRKSIRPIVIFKISLFHLQKGYSSPAVRGLCERGSLWISQHFVLGRIYPGLSALWISQHFVLGRIYPGLSALWITHAGARCGFPSISCSGAYVRMLAHAVDFPALRARAHISACWRTLWISQHFVLGRIYPGLSALWIRGEMWGAGHRGAVVHLGSISI